MNTSPENMLARLLDDINAGAPQASDQWPPSCQTLGQNILDVIAQANNSTQELAQELLSCYDAINNSFDGITAVARSTQTLQGVTTLTREIGQAVNSDFTFYVGPLPGADKQQNALDYQPPVITPPDKNQKENADFWAKNQESIMPLCDHQKPHGIALINPADKLFDDHDHEGRGNVLAIRISGGGKSDNWSGHILCARKNDKDLFAAIDMNLALALAKTGSAVLDNIVYAEKLRSAFMQTVAALVRTIEEKDQYTCGHSTRVSSIAQQLGQIAGVGPLEVYWLEQAGLLHDIGKIGIPDQVLTKPGRLTLEEFTQIKSHPTKSAKVLQPIKAMAPVLDAVKHHHEHFDGSGYPDGLAGAEIPKLARILQIADVWDALTSTRSYRGAMSQEQALQIMNKEAGSTMDPELVSKFVEMINAKQQKNLNNKSA